MEQGGHFRACSLRPDVSNPYRFFSDKILPPEASARKAAATRPDPQFTLPATRTKKGPRNGRPFSKIVN